MWHKISSSSGDDIDALEEIASLVGEADLQAFAAIVRTLFLFANSHLIFIFGSSLTVQSAVFRSLILGPVCRGKKLCASAFLCCFNVTYC